MHHPTPRVSGHARARCAEMEISTKIAKRIVRHADTTYPGSTCADGPSVVHLWAEEPAYAVVTDTARQVIITVLFNTHAPFLRCGPVAVPA